MLASIEGENAGLRTSRLPYQGYRPIAITLDIVACTSSLAEARISYHHNSVDDFGGNCLVVVTRPIALWLGISTVTVAQLEAIFGWQGGAMASLYTRAADRRRLSIEAMHKLGASANPKKEEAAN